MINKEQYILPIVDEHEWQTSKCDKYDYLIAVACGGLAGLIDVFFVGSPLTSKIGKYADKVADKLTQKVAQMFWSGDQRMSGKPKRCLRH